MIDPYLLINKKLQMSPPWDKILLYAKLCFKSFLENTVDMNIHCLVLFQVYIISADLKYIVIL